MLVTAVQPAGGVTLANPPSTPIAARMTSPLKTPGLFKCSGAPSRLELLALPTKVIPFGMSCGMLSRLNVPAPPSGL